MQVVTVFYIEDTSLELKHATLTLSATEAGRVIIPDEFKQGKSVLMVCRGQVEVLNRIGDRVTVEQPAAANE